MNETEQKVRSLLNVMDSFPDKDRGVVDTAEMREICQSWLELHRERDEARAGNHQANEYEPTWAQLVDAWKQRATEAETRGYERGVRQAADAVEEHETNWKVGPSENKAEVRSAILALLEPKLSDLPHNEKISETAHTLQKPEA
jgi:hypothetical protein